MGSVRFRHQEDQEDRETRIAVDMKLAWIHANPHYWSLFVRSGAKSLRETGELPSGVDHPLWAEIIRRHDLHPVRFDHWHPCLAKMFHHPVGTPVTPPVIPPTRPPGGGSVPEPSSIVLLALSAGWLILSRLRKFLTARRDV